MKSIYITISAILLFIITVEAKVIIIPFDDLVIAVKVEEEPEYVIHISVDALFGGAISDLGPSRVPNLYKMIAEGATTTTAQTDNNYTTTLPNHVSQFTGLAVSNHGWTTNSYESGSGLTTVSTSVFTEMAAAGMSTSLYAQKDKFALFPTTWGSAINKYVYDNSNGLVDSFIEDLQTNKRNYAFVHLTTPDFNGHVFGFDHSVGSEYYDAIVFIDFLVGAILNFIENDSYFSDKTVVILTSDHGSTDGLDVHDDANLSNNHRVPFFVWGTGVSKGANLASLNSNMTISNRHAASLALNLLGLTEINSSDNIENW